MENDAPVVGPDAPTADSKMVKRDIANRGLASANFQFARDTIAISGKRQSSCAQQVRTAT
jgi:hypothetical protein